MRGVHGRQEERVPAALQAHLHVSDVRLQGPGDLGAVPGVPRGGGGLVRGVHVAESAEGRGERGLGLRRRTVLTLSVSSAREGPNSTSDRHVSAHVGAAGCALDVAYAPLFHEECTATRGPTHRSPSTSAWWRSACAEAAGGGASCCLGRPPGLVVLSVYSWLWTSMRCRMACRA